jgi:hypothetical protein
MGNSKNAEKMKIILGDISTKLKDEGFRKRGNTYNRTIISYKNHLLEHHVTKHFIWTYYQSD